MLGEGRKPLGPAQKVGDGAFTEKWRSVRARTYQGIQTNHPISVMSLREWWNGKSLLPIKINDPVNLVEKPVKGTIQERIETIVRFPLPGFLGGKEQQAKNQQGATERAKKGGGWRSIS